MTIRLTLTWYVHCILRRSSGMLTVARVLTEKAKTPLRDVRDYLLLPRAARAEHNRDWKGLPKDEPGLKQVSEESAAWLIQAQENSRTRDGGVARHFSLLTGWGPSYPETTGYIVPTLLNYYRHNGEHDVLPRVRRMLDWLVSIQLPDGSFQGGTAELPHKEPTVFNTGQILLGLAAGVREFGDTYRKAMRRAADWLVAIQDPDGCWRRFGSTLVIPGEKTYDTHVAWGLIEAARIDQNDRYGEAALANVRWALTRQRSNGWFENCCLTDFSRPLTHTLGYALRGVIEAYRYSKDPTLLQASRRTADGLITALRPDGYLAGRLDSNWRGGVRWVCLTGSAQIAACWFLLFEITGAPRFLAAARIANKFVRRTIRVDGPPGIRGGVKGSFPVWGDYGKYEYLNWACKFLLDSNSLEKRFSQS